METIKSPNIASNALELVGNTPLVKLSKIDSDLPGNIIAKLESFNPLGSVKERIALSMIETAEKKGELKKGMTIIEPTSGNTGIGLAFVSAIKGYKLILTMPDTMSVERRKVMQALGAEIILTPGAEGMKGAIEKAKELSSNDSDYYMPQQFENPANPEVHRKTTAQEIWNGTAGKIDILVSGVGTGGTITGCGETLKKLNSKIKVIAVEPEESPVLSGGKPGPHKIQGIGAGFIPKILNTEIIDEVIQVSSSSALEIAKMLTNTEGIFAGISSGAAVSAAIEVAKKEESKDKMIVVILPDTGERYLSIL